MEYPAIRPFGTTADGEAVHQITLRSGNLICEVLTYGATLRSLLVPDSRGNPVDVVLGYDTLHAYETCDGYLGATVGRFANRIADSRFCLNGRTYQLRPNDGPNHLHGGVHGFSHRVWSIEWATAHSVCLSLTSPDGDEGYPGNLQVRLTYCLDADALTLHYHAVSDADTLCNLTNHTYFNLAGHNSGRVDHQQIRICVDCYTPSDTDHIPLGIIASVAGTPMDLRIPYQLAAGFQTDFPQLKQTRGYDHNYVLSAADGRLRKAADTYCASTGIGMQVDTTLPGLQLYTANFLDRRTGKGGCVYEPHHGFCLETQFFPDAPNQPAFVPAVLKADSCYDHITAFRFETAPRP